MSTKKYMTDTSKKSHRKLYRQCNTMKDFFDLINSSELDYFDFFDSIEIQDFKFDYFVFCGNAAYHDIINFVILAFQKSKMYKYSQIAFQGQGYRS